jgi:hypothetical protein
MSKKEFNKYCTSVIGLIVKDEVIGGGLFVTEKHRPTFAGRFYNPYDDLNQKADVFDKLMSKEGFLVMKFFTYDGNKSVKQIPIADCMHDFITSTMPEVKL